MLSRQSHEYWMLGVVYPSRLLSLTLRPWIGLSAIPALSRPLAWKTDTSTVVSKQSFEYMINKKSAMQALSKRYTTQSKV